mmetsp:Transcript_7139/g.11581  ORF Transcript_7139/g.11581 Transcript_7139/m.11581 type:complete len:269 (-) Transcript_7139:955-1761(-)
MSTSTGGVIASVSSPSIAACSSISSSSSSNDPYPSSLSSSSSWSPKCISRSSRCQRGTRCRSICNICIGTAKRIGSSGSASSGSPRAPMACRWPLLKTSKMTSLSCSGAASSKAMLSLSSASSLFGGELGPDSGVVCVEEAPAEEGATVERPSSERSSSGSSLDLPALSLAASGSGDSIGVASSGRASNSGEPNNALTRGGGENVPMLGVLGLVCSNHQRGHHGKICFIQSSVGKHGVVWLLGRQRKLIETAFLYDVGNIQQRSGFQG